MFVEHLVSQSRNYNQDVKISTTGLSGSFSTIPAGGTMTLMVGGTYWIELDASTATNGYEQIESFINFPNTVFQVLAVTTTYSANSSGNIPSPDNKLYGNGCSWENNPYDPSYRSCLGVGKAGGLVTVIYKRKILSVPSVNPEPLNTLIYDFSGSSYHYNSDYAVSVRYANIVNASIKKAFSPKIIPPGGTSTLTFTITNPGPQAISDVNFSDNLALLQTGMSIASTTITTSGCGSPTSNPGPLAVGTTSFSFSNITVNALSTCTIAVTVTAPSNGTYNNQSGNLYIGTNDTGSYATDALVVSSKPNAPESCGGNTVTLASWNFTSGTSATTQRPDVAFAEALFNGSTSGVTSGYWWGQGWRAVSPVPTSNETNFQFRIDTSNYGGVSIQFQMRIDANGKWTGTTNFVRVWESANNAAFTTVGVDNSDLSTTFTTYTRNLTTLTGVADTRFRIQGYYRKTQNPEAEVYLDNVSIIGCPRPVDPRLSKAFSPTTIAQGSASTLTFTFVNPNSTALTAVNFSDTLPAGLVIATPSGLTTPSCTPAGALTGQNITANADSTNINMSGGTLAANSSCSFSVNVLGSVAGQYQNISGNITSTETGPNYTTDGYGRSDLTVIAPPVIAKSFRTNTLISGNTTTLTFALSNPNRTEDLTGVQFTDSLPSGMVVATPNGQTAPTCSTGSISGAVISATPGSSTISLGGASLTAGATCTFSVNVTGTTALDGELKTNSVTVSSTNGGTGNTSTANIYIKRLKPAITITKQVGLTNNLDGAWYSSKLLISESAVYYKFTVENIGDANFTSFSVTDPTLQAGFGNPLTCTWYQANPIPPGGILP